MQAIEKQVFIRKGAKLPEQLRIQGNAIDGNWVALESDAGTLDRQIRAAGWHFFWLTEQVEVWAVATNRENAINAALRKALKKIGALRNAAEVVGVHYHSLLGTHYCRVRLAARHIQFGPMLGLTSSVSLISPAFEPERPSSFQEFSREAA